MSLKLFKDINLQYNIEKEKYIYIMKLIKVIEIITVYSIHKKLLLYKVMILH